MRLPYPTRPLLLLFATLLVLASATPAPPSTQTTWTGISTPPYLLLASSPEQRDTTLNAIRAAGLRVVRVILSQVEPHVVGQYDDTILARLDDLLFQASARRLKVTLALHDRWALGCTSTDAYARKYHLQVVANCTPQGANARGNDPARFYDSGRVDFKARIAHVLGYVSRHTGMPLGAWDDALLSVEAQHEAYGAAFLNSTRSARESTGNTSSTTRTSGTGSTVATASIPTTAAAASHADRLCDWLCEMSTAVRNAVAPGILVGSGGGGIGFNNADGGAREFARAAVLAACPAIDVLALHSYSVGDTAAATVDGLLQGYAAAIAGATVAPKDPAGAPATPATQATHATQATRVAASSTRLVLQRWRAVGGNSTEQADAFRATARVAANHRVPQMFDSIHIQPTHNDTTLSPPQQSSSPSPSPSPSLSPSSSPSSSPPSSYYTSLVSSVSPPGAAPSPGAQRVRSSPGGEWINSCR